MTDIEFWTPQRARLLGALIEKGLATPQNYPLSINALVGACNQTTNRDPITDLSESEVEALLDQGKIDGLVRFVHPRSGRGVTKYRHVVDEVLRLEPTELALLGVLLLRGPQTVSELRSRTERLAGFGGNDEVEETLAALARREPQALVVRLEREPGHRERRWVQLICPAQGEDRSGVAASPAPAPQTAPPNVLATAAEPRRMPDPFAVGESATDEDAPVVDAASTTEAGEVAELRAEVVRLRSELDEFRAAFEAFRRQFE